ncbi:MAG: peptidase and subtilisin, kexin, sedolisin, partial [Proteobacteria bacterium]|nr:peptidase and subtilisin, kexin, sedolisin [Pseudomonadota bacterium]
NSCVSRMGSPEIAFNALAVGAFADRGTVTYTDDVHACNPLIDPAFSAFLDPLSPNRDREEPDVVAPGVDIATTIPDGGFLDTIGTSFAAPHVVGTVTLLANRRPELANENERVRAIVMASARHNIEGASRLSERDGAGAIMASAADRVLLDGQSWFKITPGGISGFPYTQTFRASEGERVRVVIVWSHKMPLGQNLTRPTTDLDLVVLRGSTVLGSSTSFDNTFEIVEFRAPATGIYTARIQNRRSSRGPEHIGLAVSRRSL